MKIIKSTNFHNYICFETDTLLDALLKIEKNSHRCAIVIDNRFKVVGTISDGDARKALIDGRILQTPLKKIMNTKFTHFIDEPSEDAKKIFQKGHFFVIPRTNKNKILVEILAS